MYTSVPADSLVRNAPRWGWSRSRYHRWPWGREHRRYACSHRSGGYVFHWL